jgi:hypothetical protein
MNDPLLERLAALPSATPRPVRARRVRARCHRALGRRRPRPVNRWRRATQYWPHVVAGLAGIYFAETVRQVLGVWGIL